MTVSWSLGYAQGNSNNKGPDKDLKINKGKINSTLNKAKKLDIEDIEESDDEKEEIDIDSKVEKDTQLEKSIKREAKKVIKKSI